MSRWLASPTATPATTRCLGRRWRVVVATKRRRRAAQPTLRFDERLVLNRYLLALFGVETFEQLAVGLLPNATPEQKQRGDVNKDGKNDLKDATLILHKAVGLPTSF